MGIIKFTSLDGRQGRFTLKKAKTFKEPGRQKAFTQNQRLYQTLTGIWVLCNWESDEMSYYDTAIPGTYTEITEEQATAWLEKNSNPTQAYRKK